MDLRSITNDLPMPAWIVLVVLGFVLFWPLGVVFLAYLIWSGKMTCCVERMACWNGGGLRRRDARIGKSRFTGNIAFDEYREATLRRLEEERQEFTEFLSKLRRAKDQAEFDKFMAEQTTPQSQA